MCDFSHILHWLWCKITPVEKWNRLMFFHVISYWMHCSDNNNYTFCIYFYHARPSKILNNKQMFRYMAIFHLWCGQIENINTNDSIIQLCRFHDAYYRTNWFCSIFYVSSKYFTIDQFARCWHFIWNIK